LVNIEGEIQKIIPQQDKTNMTGGKAGHVTLPCEWGSHCLTVAALPKHGTARRLSTTRKTHPSWNGGGGAGGVHRGVTQEQHCTSPSHPPTPPHVGEKSTLPKHGTAHPLSPPKNPPIVEWGGGRQGVFTVAPPKNTTASRLSPPKKPTIRVMGGGTKGCSKWRHSNTAVHVAYPPLPHVAYPPLPPPPLMSWKIKIKNETYLSGGIPKAADDALKQG
jgi:hypothetical protein